MIVFWTWCSFLANNFWVRLHPVILHSVAELDGIRWIELVGF